MKQKDQIYNTITQSIRPLSATEIAHKINALPSSVSSQLTKMRKLGIVKDSGFGGPKGGITYVNCG
jgi:DNA-binding transcriptional regulator GbsR (MarR family)